MRARAAKSWFGVVGSLIPVLFCGGLFLYLSNVNNAFGGMLDHALGPTRMGLGALTLLFGVLFLWKLKVASTPPPPKAALSPADGKIEEAKSDFDADAAMARYLARRGSGAGTDTAAAPAPSFGNAQPSGFGTAQPSGFGTDSPPRPPSGGFGRKGTLG